MRGVWLALALVAACGTDEAGAPTADTGLDTTVTVEDAGADTTQDAGVDAATLVDAAPDVPTLEIVAENYCELTREMFCDYYLRCGRIHAADRDACLEIFDEQCNAVYEPHYRALADQGMLELSQTGMLACAEHLQTVACEQQMFDLDAGCAGMWVGKVPAGGPCAPGIESFVCQPSATCVLGLDFCGTCEAAVRDGSACGPDVARCDDGFACIDGACVRRGEVGDVCSAELPCRIGAACTNGRCTGFDVVTVGDTCGQGLRCPYNSFCRQGVCVASKAVGESCTPADECRSGFCDQGTCQLIRRDGDACNTNPQCISGVCNQGTCGPLPGACFN